MALVSDPSLITISQPRHSPSRLQPESEISRYCVKRNRDQDDLDNGALRGRNCLQLRRDDPVDLIDRQRSLMRRLAPESKDDAVLDRSNSSFSSHRSYRIKKPRLIRQEAFRIPQPRRTSIVDGNDFQTHRLGLSISVN
jgi:hypothetical protein